MAEPKTPIVEKPIVETVSINGIEIVNDHISNIKIKNIWENEISFESGIISPGKTGLITAPEAEALHIYVEKV